MHFSMNHMHDIENAAKIRHTGRCDMEEEERERQTLCLTRRGRRETMRIRFGESLLLWKSSTTTRQH